ncbi:Radical SAM domain protein [Methylocella silvestris BL2]|uniref:Radical SAM domain protein n=1 Tax=Methylocella silvestris (strain DSM 15510 / CIP 108128 / LMG 27833 / NCIMB 13906 / BL2) TaxID=395965 RepID=B8EQ28_METSB|nr:cyclophane-forming radical SAM/SPASM peptide maturase GrrM/OscB [Methylocella silvestris]ACK51518.1 Radical SAM domain protein [Methylocella silvestris BL2]
MLNALSTGRAAPTIETVVVQPTPFCNINCRYCYLPDRNQKAKMELSVITTLFSKIFASGWSADQLTVIWHAGEPLVLPVSYYETALRAIEALRPPEVAVRHAIQTNGMLISPEWCALFKQWDVGVGVSIDGPQALHDANRVTRSGLGTFAQTIAGLRLLQREKVPFHVISVLSAESLQSPEAMLDFYLAEGVEDICFNVEESEGDHVSGLFAAADTPRRFREFLSRFWTLARQSGQVRFIREIDDMLERIFRPESCDMGNAQVEPFGMLNVACDGSVSSFSPELLGLKNAAYNDFIVGNILTDSLEAMLGGEAMTAMTRDIAAGVELCRQSCEYFSVCGGGAPVNKLSENGGFSSGATSFCKLTEMIPADLALAAFEQLERTMPAPEIGAARFAEGK